MAQPYRSKPSLSDSASTSEDEERDYDRTSTEIRRHDDETLMAEEEAERLLGAGTTSSDSKETGLGWNFAGRREERRLRRREGRRERRRGNGRGDGEKREVVYDMETGRRSSSEDSGANSSAGSSEAEVERLKTAQAGVRKRSRSSRIRKLTLINIPIVAIILLLPIFAYRYQQTSDHQQYESLARTLSNGTHTFLPTTLLLSLDGFRADFLTQNLTPTLNAFIRSGISPPYMTPAFPSLTFPNHFTLVTGLYPESHGVVGNTFWDPSIGKEFYYTDPDRSMQPEWWAAEPIWATAEASGLRSAIHMWPGSEAHLGLKEPEFVDAFNGHEDLGRKVERILGWLDLPGDLDVVSSEAREEGQGEGPRRPQLIAAYVPNVDQDGHKFGPNSTEIRSTIRKVDGMLATLFAGIAARNLTDIVNIIVVSDHGMATTSTSRLLQLDDLVDTSLIAHTDGWPLYGLRPYNTSQTHLEELYESVLVRSLLPQFEGKFNVYLRDRNMPPEFHFTANPRIAPLWLVPKTGWAIVPKSEFDVPSSLALGIPYAPRGLHGYDPNHPLMRAIFVARGPAFPHVGGSKVAPFSNVEVYNVVCDSLGLAGRKGNGTLRLPFVTQGRYDFDDGVGGGGHPLLEVPEDLYDEFANAPALEEGPGMFGSPPVSPNAVGEGFPAVASASPSARPQEEPNDSDGESVDRPVVHDGADEKALGLSRWVEWIKAQMEAWKVWAKEHLDDAKEAVGMEVEKSENETQTETGSASASARV